MSRIRHESALSTQFLKFVLVGLAATATTYSVLIALIEMWQVKPVPASVAGYMAGMVVNYALNYRFTFRSGQRHRVAAPRFFLVVLVGLFINTLLMYLGVHQFGLHYAVAQLLAVAMVVFWSFVANRFWAFSGQ